MADLRSRFIEDFAGGLLNISRQELSTTGEVLSQDGLTSEGTLFVEDGSGVKSGLRLGVNLAECVDPTTETGLVNVRFADRTYAKIRDLKIFSTAIASAQSALAEATTLSISNLETTVQLLDDDITSLEQGFQRTVSLQAEQIQTLSLSVSGFTEGLNTNTSSIKNLENRVSTLENPPQSTINISALSTTENAKYYTGTIAINGAVVTGTSTLFSTELNTGDAFVTVIDDKEVEFRITSISSNTSLTVTPTSYTEAGPLIFRKNSELQIKTKINEIIVALRQLDLIV